MKPKKWTDVYPHGTKEGDEELGFFIALARNPKYQWRSTTAIAKETGLSRERVEEIINKYYKKGMVFQNPKNEDQWGYWERVPEMLPKAKKSIARKDQDDRIGKVSKDCGKDSCDSSSCGACDKVIYNNDKYVCTYVKDADVYYVEMKGSDKAENFIASIRKQFAKKKSGQVGISSRGVGQGVEERWHAPTTDEDIWIPIRPKKSVATHEESYNAQAASEWEFDL